MDKDNEKNLNEENPDLRLDNNEKSKESKEDYTEKNINEENPDLRLDNENDDEKDSDIIKDEVKLNEENPDLRLENSASDDEDDNWEVDHQRNDDLKQDLNEKDDSSENSEINDAQKENGKKKRGFWKLLLIPLVLAVFYFGVAIYFTNRALPNTFVNGKDVSMRELSSIDPLEGLMPESIEITKKDGSTIVLKPEDADIKLDLEKALLIQQDNFKWPLSLIEKDEYEVNIITKYDEGKVNSFIETNFIKDSINPEDAKLEKKDGVFVIIPEVEGNKIDKKIVQENIMNAIINSEDKIDLTEFYEVPEIRKDDEKLVKTLEEIKKYTDKELSIDFLYTKEKIDESLLSSFVELGDDLSIKINKEMLKNYLVELAQKHDTFDKYRDFESTTRGMIQVPPGIYGYQMNIEETEKLVEESLNNGTKEIQPVYTVEGNFRNEDGTDIGSTYIEIDLAAQHMWYYENGELMVSTPVVTGDPTKGVATPPGVGVVWHKERNKPLEGIDPAGNPYVAYVDYWMVVDWSHDGIHNARWRENAGGFGGNIYQGNGSFGCINTPYNEVQTMYEMVAVGTPVIIYE